MLTLERGVTVDTETSEWLIEAEILDDATDAKEYSAFNGHVCARRRARPRRGAGGVPSAQAGERESETGSPGVPVPCAWACVPQSAKSCAGDGARRPLLTRTVGACPAPARRARASASHWPRSACAGVAVSRGALFYRRDVLDRGLRCVRALRGGGEARRRARAVRRATRAAARTRAPRCVAPRRAAGLTRRAARARARARAVPWPRRRHHAQLLVCTDADAHADHHRVRDRPVSGASAAGLPCARVLRPRAAARACGCACARAPYCGYAERGCACACACAHARPCTPPAIVALWWRRARALSASWGRHPAPRAAAAF